MGKLDEPDLQREARDHVIIGLAQRLFHGDFAEVNDAVGLLYELETQEEEPDEAIVASCELLLERPRRVEPRP